MVLAKASAVQPCPLPHVHNPLFDQLVNMCLAVFEPFVLIAAEPVILRGYNTGSDDIS